MAQLKGYSVTLNSGSEVFVGFNPEQPDDDSYYFLFKSDEKGETRLRLSKDAYEAIVDLKRDVDLFKNVGECVRWVAVMKNDGDVSVNSVKD